MRLVLLFFVAGLLCQECVAQTAESYAVRMNASGSLRHDASFGGAEIIYRSSGMATEADARRWWMNSPRHRALLTSGAITDIACVGNVCVGRSSGASGRTYQVQRQRMRVRIRR